MEKEIKSVLLKEIDTETIKIFDWLHDNLPLSFTDDCKKIIAGIRDVINENGKFPDDNKQMWVRKTQKDLFEKYGRKVYKISITPMDERNEYKLYISVELKENERPESEKGHKFAMRSAEVVLYNINEQPKEKTFYTVEYAVWGAIHTNKRVFDNKKEAEEFAATDYCDSPVKHTIRNTRSNEEEIESWENWLKEQKEEDEEWEENRKNLDANMRNG